MSEIKSRTHHSPEFKVNIALQAIVHTTLGSKTVKQIADENDIHQTQVSQWKKHLLDNAPRLFQRSSKSFDIDLTVDPDKITEKISELVSSEASA